MDDIQKFQCSACGKCCSRISGFVSGSEKKFIEEYGYGKMPLVQLVPPEKMSFPLWDFEAKRFKQYAKEKNMDAKIEPGRGIMDLRSNRFIILTYQMSMEACPFLAKDGKCIIHEKKRAFVCYLFPLNKTPFLDTGEKNSKDMFGSCPNISEIIDNLDFNEKSILIKQLHASFGEGFVAAVQHDFVMEWSNRLIIELAKKKQIKPAINYPYNFLKKRIANSEKIDFTDFLRENKGNAIVDELIKRFQNYVNAKEKLKDFL